MADTVLVIDELDGGLGLFFQSCKDDLDIFFAEFNIQVKFLNSNNLNDLSVQLTTAPFEKFIFGAYSHGSTTSLTKLNIPYISTSINNTIFGNTFFYTFSCSCGHELGSHLIENGCLCFIGYNKVISIWSTYIRPFVICANFGLKLFYNGINTSQIIMEMKNQYNYQIDELYPKDFMIASILRENRDALVKHGNDINITNLTNA